MIGVELSGVVNYPPTFEASREVHSAVQINTDNIEPQSFHFSSTLLDCS